MTDDNTAQKIRWIHSKSEEVIEHEYDRDEERENIGQTNSLLSIALSEGVELEHACGGNMACSTCHVSIARGSESCNERSEAEAKMASRHPDFGPNSRLACQCVPTGDKSLIVMYSELT